MSAFDLDEELGPHKQFEPGMMPCSYHQILSPVALSVADLTTYRNGYVLNRINVPKAHRGQGRATWLLKRVLEVADKFDTTLWLIVSPSDGLGFSDLIAWYKRHDFVSVYAEPGLMMRSRPSIRNY